MLLSLLFKIDLATACQSFRSTDAQKRYDDDAKHDERDGGHDDMLYQVKILCMLPPVEERHGQTGGHVDQDDRYSDNGPYQRKSRRRTVHQTRQQGTDHCDCHGDKNGNARRAKAIRMRQRAGECPGAAHSVEHTSSCVDACIGIGKSAIEYSKTDNELEWSPHTCCHGCPGV